MPPPGCNLGALEKGLIVNLLKGKEDIGADYSLLDVGLEVPGYQGNDLYA